MFIGWLLRYLIRSESSLYKEARATPASENTSTVKAIRAAMLNQIIPDEITRRQFRLNAFSRSVFNGTNYEEFHRMSRG